VRPDPPRHVALLRDRVIRVQVFADLLERLAELETGIPEHRRQAPALHRHLDDLERDVMALVAARLGTPGSGTGT
jgi:hypothetical protein